MSLTLATILTVDGTEQEGSVLYPNLGKLRPAQERRQIYWQAVNVFCATARRCYPDAQIWVITNDFNDLNLDGMPISRLRERLDVQHCRLPFAEFKPPRGVSRKFLNSFYRMDAVQYLANNAGAEDGILLLDSDCVFAHRIAELETLIPKNGIWSYTALGAMEPYLVSVENLSRAQMGDTFRVVDATYPNPFPIWYGGEFLGGHRAAFQTLLAEMKRVWKLLLERAVHPPLRFANGESFFDNDEYVLSYVLNEGRIPTTSANEICRRMVTLEGVRNIRPGDEKFPVWHTPSEKRRGLALLFTQSLDPNSLFWKSSSEDFYRYLGDYLGVPHRRHDLPYDPREQVERITRIGARWIRRKLSPARYSHSVVRS